MEDDIGQQNKKVSEIDYMPLSQPVSNVDVTVFRHANEPQRSRSKPLLVTGFIVIGFVAFMLLVLGVLLIEHNGFYASFGPLMVWVLIIGAVMYFVQHATMTRYRFLVRLHRFAIRNGLQLKYDTQVATNYPGMIFDEGHSRQVSEVLIFPKMGEIGNYSYITGSGKDQTTHHWAYLKIKLPRKLPHMVLDAKKNNFFGKFSNLTDTFDRSQTLSLEGDFDEHFTLYAPKQYERDAFYIFTPDVMAKLIDNGGNYDMEVIEDELYLYKSGKIDLAAETELRALLSIIEAIGTEIHQQTDYYADDKVGDRTQNIIAVPGSRLKHGINWVTVVFVFIAIVFYTSDFWGYLLFQR